MAIKIAGVDVINDDRELVLAKLTDIHKTENITAVDVFVYDTSNDSDGGAWRHRTQHTSWYNEGVSSTRGSRKEFPAVAVIVAESNKVTIYDGDDPSLPMWMVFNATNKGIWITGLTGVAAINGAISVSGAGPSYFGWSDVNFISEIFRFATNSAQRVLLNSVAERNDAASIGTVDTSKALVNSIGNDVAMTVLPDAPTDPATGLPVPTIAVATDGGVSVIKDDGTVVDITTTVTKPSYFVGFTDDHKLRYQIGDRNGLRIDTIPSTDFSVGGHSAQNNSEEFYSPGALVASGWAGNLNFLGSNQFGDLGDIGFSEHAIRSVKGLTFIDRNPTTPANGMVAYTTSSYTTGWMNGDIKLAALADTTAETLGDAASGATVSDPNVDGVYDGEHVTNGDFATDTDWTKGSGVTIGGGVATLSSATAGAHALQQAASLTAGKVYCFKFTVSNYGSGQLAPNILGVAGSGEYVGSNGTFTQYLAVPSGSTPTGISLYVNTAFTGDIDNISVRLADPDRSVNGNGLAVHGSLTKAAVATGADVVGYSNFSSGNYLEQPYNADLDFGAYTGTAGTGDFCVIGWVNPSSIHNGTIFHRALSGSNGGLLLRVVNNDVQFYASATTSFVQVLASTTELGTNVYHHVCLVRDAGVLTLYLNGSVDTSVSFSGDVTYPDAITKIGNRHDVNSAWNGSLALIRISATAPTADQIKKIYEDEKVLFQENAKATLYYDGTSSSPDAVTALAHDPVTDLLHVGTSAGRSVFQGLRRVEESTGTDSQSLAAISAVDGLVVEGK